MILASNKDFALGKDFDRGAEKKDRLESGPSVRNVNKLPGKGSLGTAFYKISISTMRRLYLFCLSLFFFGLNFLFNTQYIHFVNSSMASCAMLSQLGRLIWHIRSVSISWLPRYSGNGRQDRATQASVAEPDRPAR
ncbi:hypothetical protein QO058_14505 [Bosea vestrisii]|uniref:hypothetical protein n=1 Tax=Bosea vestrisii TaxID=151416 RepID=UPI0024DFCBA5|nr:hypothetical protein [Bosea vestrisii]WID99335.1 hypothetical protein QO058_14505 [Bosea vestrisii]